MEHHAPCCSWLTFWAGPQDVPDLVLENFNRKDKKGLRGTSAQSRTAVNVGVRKAVISDTHDLQRLADLKLHERFPNLGSVVLTDGDTHDGKKVVRSIVDFVVTTLSKLPRLTSVDLSSCTELDAAGAAQAMACCHNLQQILMPAGAKVTNETLQLLAQITSLTNLKLDNNHSIDAIGLQHLSNLHQLQSLQCQACPGIADASITALAQLKGLTCLDLLRCDVQGSTLGQLSALSRLQQLWLPALGDHQHLTALQSLTALTHLAMPSSITDACKGILELPNLQMLNASSIHLEAAPTSSMCSKLASLALVGITRSVARLLPLPELQRLICLLTALVEGHLPGQEVASAIASQTSLTSLMMLHLDIGNDLADVDVVTMVTPLKKLERLSLSFAKEGSGSIAAFQAIAALPELRELRVEHVQDTLHIALLQRCPKLEVLSVSDMQLETGTLAGLVCKLGMHKVIVKAVKGFDRAALQAVADSVGVELVVE